MLIASRLHLMCLAEQGHQAWIEMYIESVFFINKKLTVINVELGPHFLNCKTAICNTASQMRTLSCFCGLLPPIFIVRCTSETCRMNWICVDLFTTIELSQSLMLFLSTVRVSHLYTFKCLAIACLLLIPMQNSLFFAFNFKCSANFSILYPFQPCIQYLKTFGSELGLKCKLLGV